MNSVRTTKLLLLLALMIVVAIWFSREVAKPTSSTTEAYQPRPAGTLTFSKDIAPIFLKHCAGCHCPGQAAPFSLAAYADIQRRTAEILEVIESGSMPPWLPELGTVSFANQRRLSIDELGMMQQWIREGAVQGDPALLPEPPSWKDEWQLGTPDLVVTLPEPFLVQPVLTNLYRNFVIPLPLASTAYVRAVEFRPGNPKLIRSAILRADRTPAARLEDAQDAEPGFPGPISDATSFISGGFIIASGNTHAVRSAESEFSWRLNPDTDLVLQLHFNPSDKPEPVQPAIALYFSPERPERYFAGVVLRSRFLDIPPGDKGYRAAEDQFDFPVDATLHSLYPQAQHLAKEITVTATFPDRTRQTLLHIKDWNPRWQEEYQLAEPLPLPQGTILSMQYTYDNSRRNPRNPHQPPRRTVYGHSANDEIADLLVKLSLTREDRQRLRQYAASRSLFVDLTVLAERARDDPPDPDTYFQLAYCYLQIGRLEHALDNFEKAATLNPDSAAIQFRMGEVLAQMGQFNEAVLKFKKASDLAPDDPETLHAISEFLLRLPGRSETISAHAIDAASKAAQLTQQKNPVILETLANAYLRAGDQPQAVRILQSALETARALDADGMARHLEERLEMLLKDEPAPRKPAAQNSTR